MLTLRSLVLQLVPAGERGRAAEQGPIAAKKTRPSNSKACTFWAGQHIVMMSSLAVTGLRVDRHTLHARVVALDICRHNWDQLEVKLRQCGLRPARSLECSIQRVGHRWRACMQHFAIRACPKSQQAR